MGKQSGPLAPAVATALGLAGLVSVGAVLFSPALLRAQTTGTQGRLNGQSRVDAQAAIGARPSVGAEGGAKTITLEQRLTFGLQARRPSERAFIASVVDSVNRGDLPRRLVDRTFFWARNRATRVVDKSARRPIIYFQPALTIQARRLGIEIRPNGPPASS